MQTITILTLNLVLNLTFFTYSTKAATITATTNNGNWALSSTWDLHRIPASGDVVTIPAGKTVILNTDVFSGVSPSPVLQINVYGTLAFDCEGALNLGCGSYVCTFGSGQIPTTGSATNKIAIGGQLAWKGTNSSVSAGSCTIASCSSSPLPVDLLSFEASYDKDVVNVDWAIASETNFNHFELERSQNAIDFETITSIDGASETTYSYTDVHPLPGASYYRLKEIDNDNTFHYSPIAAVKNEQNTPVSVYPNPSVGTDFKVIVPETNTFATAFLKDLTGKIIAEKFSSNGTTVISFENTPIPGAGIYLIEVTLENQSYSTKVVVK